MRVAGLDLSLVRAGIAILQDGRPAKITSVGHASVSGASYEMRSRRMTSQCQSVLRQLDGPPLDLAVIEDQLAHGPMLPSALDRSALWWGVYSALLQKHVPVVVVNPMTLKVWVTGKGTASKTDMLDTVRGWYRQPVTNHDEADAVGLATVGAYHAGDPLPFTVKDRHTAIATTKITWPEVAR